MSSLDPPASKTSCITIVGAGLFGLTTALELTRRGYKNVQVVDRYLPPVADGSSVDISRIIRPDYADAFYAKLGLEAMRGWGEGGEYSPFFYRSGLLCMAGEGSHPYLEQSQANLEKMGIKTQNLRGNEMRERYPGVISGDLARARGYANTICGWADAQQAISYLARQCTQAGVSFLTGSHGTVLSLVTNGANEVIGVRTLTGAVIKSDQVILATGAWTPHLLDMANMSVSTGQPVGFLQLTEQEAEQMKDSPVIIDLSTGWFVFPPTPGTRILKMARHGYGYETSRTPSLQRDQKVSVPKLDSSNVNSTFLPTDAELALRQGLALFFPQLKDRPFINRRLCWYTDTPQGDFVIDHHPSYKNLFVATGGSGHAFKFLPALGRHIVDNFEHKASTEQKEKWAWKPTSTPISKGDGSRGGPPRRVLRRDEQARL
ncbi:FAD dependent oxidoreductase [Xylona heveae TC161]|uniref:FAD dependent oxidoreductase n=1 Tax=Xylona heveae (strain CBS 132557 / TC161) TaxID=1328760 RepID=A0A165H6R1_XYLHT|nr:FAD dependent oxidoreductase [Xylona heveae TC161]KZF23062.1 FAD dependent oxidoreductase [Xylona heveae TC161]